MILFVDYALEVIEKRDSIQDRLELIITYTTIVQ